MRATCVGLAVLAFSTIGGEAQSAIGRSAGLDLGALAGSEIRIGLEPVVAGRWALQIGLARWATSSPPAGFRGGGVAQAAGLEATPGRTELALDLTVRHYPAFLASDHPDRRLRAFVGLGAGLTQRSDARAFCGFGGCLDSFETDRALGVDPIAEAGIRFQPAGAFLLDVGLRARMVSGRDPTNRYDAGDIVPRVVLGLGYGW